MGEDIEPFRQGSLDRLCGLYAAINAMRWATRDDNIEEEFWDEVFKSLVLCTEVQVGIADVLVSGIGRKPLHRVLEQVLADVRFHFGRTFELHRPFRARRQLSASCMTEELAWLLEQPHSGLIAIMKSKPNHWTTLIDISEGRFVAFDGHHHGLGKDALRVSALMPKSCIRISRSF